MVDWSSCSTALAFGKRLSRRAKKRQPLQAAVDFHFGRTALSKSANTLPMPSAIRVGDLTPARAVVVTVVGAPATTEPTTAPAARPP